MNVEPTESQPDTDSPSTETARPPQPAESENATPPQRPFRRPGLPAWTLGLLVLALTVVLVWAGNGLIQSRRQLPGQTPLVAPSLMAAPSPTSTPSPTAALPATPARPATSFPTPATATPAEPDETLILIADLYAPTGDPKPGADLARLLYEALAARIEEGDLEGWVHVELLDAAVSDADAARTAGGAHNAGYVLWGLDAEQGVEAYLTRAGTQASTRTTPAGHDLTLSEPGQQELCFSTEAPVQIDATVDYVLGIAAYAQGEYGAAEGYWNAAVDGAREMEGCAFEADVHLYRGNTLAWDGNDVAALAEFDAAIEMAPDLALAYANRGSVRHAQGNDEAALKDLNRALELDPALVNAYYNRAAVYQALDQAERALADLDRVLELDPQHARAYAARGLIRHSAGEHEAALEDYTRALELAPEAAEVYLNRGGTYATLGQFEAALDDYARVLELNPDDADAYYNRGTVYAMLEAYDQALADLDRALALRPDFAQVYGNRGLVYKAMGNTEQAIADLERFLEMSDNPEWRTMIEQQLAELKQE